MCMNSWGCGGFMFAKSAPICSFRRSCTFDTLLSGFRVYGLGLCLLFWRWTVLKALNKQPSL